MTKIFLPKYLQPIEPLLKALSVFNSTGANPKIYKWGGGGGGGGGS